MEQNENNDTKKQTRKTKVNTTPIRVLKTTAKKLKGLVQRLNKKPLGRKVRIDDLLLKSLDLLSEKHFSEIKEATLSNADKMELAYRQYSQTISPISKDEYIGQLLSGEIKSSSTSPTE